MVQIKKERTKKLLSEKRILVCGKGGSGKSTIVTLMANALHEKGYKVLALDGDASNPEGLLRLMFGLGEKEAPKALIKFFGGTGVVTCPVDDPAPLTRVGDSTPVLEKKIDIRGEIPSEYFIQRETTVLFQAGKIERYGQGCDGPIEKVVRDFMVKGEWVNLIDIKAGVEHFGRKIAENVDIILTILDPNPESISVANRIGNFCKEMGQKNFWLILNKVGSKDIESKVIDRLGESKSKIIGSVYCDQKVTELALDGIPLDKCKALEDMERIVEKLEKIIS